MSTGYECWIAELKPGAWYYVLQRGDCPVGAWDWTEYADVVGPFPSSEAAIKNLGDNEANPGGWYEIPYEAGDDHSRLLAEARPPRRRAW